MPFFVRNATGYRSSPQCRRPELDRMGASMFAGCRSGHGITIVHHGLGDAGVEVLNSADWPGKMTELPYSSDWGSMPVHFARLAEQNCTDRIFAASAAEGTVRLWKKTGLM